MLRTPSLERMEVNGPGWRGLVIVSTSWGLVDIGNKWMRPFWSFSQTRWQSKSICLVLSWKEGFGNVDSWLVVTCPTLFKNMVKIAFISIWATLHPWANFWDWVRPTQFLIWYQSLSCGCYWATRRCLVLQTLHSRYQPWAWVWCVKVSYYLIKWSKQPL